MQNNFIKRINFILLIFAIFVYNVKVINSSESATFPLETTHPFIIEPGVETFLVREGEPGPLLNCSIAEPFRDKNRYELEWTKVVEDKPKLISRNSLLYTPSTPNGGYQLFDNFINDGSYNLRLINVLYERDNGRFFCTLVDSGTQTQWLSEPAKIVVLVPPQAPLISSQPTDAIKEGNLASFRCESIGGNPSPHFQWLFDNKTKVPETWYLERPEANAGKSVSILQMHVKSDYNGAYLICQIWNKALKEGEKMQIHTERLNVLYAPRIHILPSTEFNVEEGQVVPLICKADANPQPTQFQWIHVPTGESHPSREWHLTMKRIHTGEFRCTATNIIDIGIGTIRLNVLYGPSVKIKLTSGNENLIEGEKLILDCETDANPRVEAIAWSGPGGLKQNGSRLVIDSINRAHAGNFTCTSWNTLPLSSTSTPIRSGFSSIFIDVRRKPGPAIITTKRLIYNIGETIILSCSTDGDLGNPSAKFKWSGPNNDRKEQKNWDRALLKIGDAKLGDNGLYRCLPYNDIGQGEESSVRVMIVEPARLIRPLLPTRTLSSNSVDVQIECEARGFPRPKIFWLKDGQHLPLDSSRLWAVEEYKEATIQGCNQQREPCPVSVRSSLQLVHPTSWTDKGNYACVAENSPTTAEASSSIMAISVVHEPIILNQKLTDGMAMAAADLGENARIVCLISARPEPRIIWTRDGVELAAAGSSSTTFKRGIDQNSRYKLSLNRVNGAIDEFESILEVTNVEERDYGIFVCEASNGAGRRKSSVDIRFQPKGIPQTPIQTKQLQSGIDWILIGWRPGFDGGERQMLELEIRPVNPFTGRPSSENEPEHIIFGSGNWTTISLFQNSDSAQTETFQIYNLTKLQPLSSVWYRLRARNSRGVSDWTAISTATSDDINEIVGRERGEIQPPESVAYLIKERKLVIQPIKNNPEYCALIYAASSEDGQMRTVNCFPLTNSDGSFNDILPSERFKVRYCVIDDISHCSTAAKIFVEEYSSSNSFWMLTLIIIIVFIIASTILILLICTRQRIKKATATTNAQLRISRGSQKAKGAIKKISLNGAAIERINGKKQNGHQQHSSSISLKNTPVNGSQSDSGVFTLNGGNSSSAISSAIIALNGGTNLNFNNKSYGDNIDSNINSTSINWKESHNQQQQDEEDEDQINNSHHHQINNSSISPSKNHQKLSSPQKSSFDEFSNDPFLLQDFTNANSIGGIVCVENSLHQNSSAESTPGGFNKHGGQQHQRLLNPYSKFFNEFSNAFLGENAKSSILMKKGFDLNNLNLQQQQNINNNNENPSSSNEQLIQNSTNNNEEFCSTTSSNNSDLCSPYYKGGNNKLNNNNNLKRNEGSRGQGGQAGNGTTTTNRSCRIMREIIV